MSKSPPRKRTRSRRPAATDGDLLHACAKVWLERAGRVVLSTWRVELLEAIDATGSLARAAAKLDVPYRTAWYKLKEVEEQLGMKLIETQSGGVDGGGSRLTAEARGLISRFRLVSSGVAKLVDERFRAEFRGVLGEP